MPRRLSWAAREGVPAGALAARIGSEAGGLKAIVAAERAARRPAVLADRLGRAARTPARRAIAGPCRSSMSLARMPFVLLLARREGEAWPIVAPVADEQMVEKAIRKAA